MALLCARDCSLHCTQINPWDLQQPHEVKCYKPQFTDWEN